MSAAELHGRIDMYCACQSLVIRGDRSEQIRNKQAIHNKAGGVEYRDWGLTEGLNEPRSRELYSFFG